MSSIDERIVSMQFDNEQFEKNVGTTLKSLTNLEKGVDGLNGINTAGITDAIENLQSRFSTMGIIGMTAIQNLTDRFVNMGVKMAKSLTIDQVSEGFNKYTENTKNVKALLNSTGESIDVVSEKLDALSWYSDATSYSYSAMVTALKKFSAQDIKMDEAIPAIMGIGNSLSYAGLAAEESSYAFELYSKAMGQGYMSMIQWKSLNNMGAATAELKRQFIDAAVAAGTLKKSADGVVRTAGGLEVSVANFENTLSDRKGKWLTNAVMMDVFSNKYGSYAKKLQDFMAQEENANLTVDQAAKKMQELYGITDEFGKKAFESAQQARTFGEAVGAVKDAASSAWRAIFENVFGNAEEATEMWTSFSDWLYDVFMGPTEMLFNLTTEWKRLGGRESMLEGFSNLAEALNRLTAPVVRAFNAIFGVATGSKLGATLKDITDKFAAFTEKLIISDETTGKLIRIFTGLFSAVKIVKDVVGELIDGFFNLLGFTKPLGSGLLDAAAKFGDFLNKTRRFIDDKGGLISGFSDLTKAVSDSVSGFHPLEAVLNKIKGLASALWGKLKEIGAQIKEVVSPAIKNLNFDSLIKAVTTLAGLRLVKVGIFDQLAGLKELKTTIGDSITKTLGSVSNAFSNFANVFTPYKSTLKEAAISIAILSAALLLLASIDADNLATGLMGMGSVMAMLEVFMKTMAGMEKYDIKKLNKLSKSFTSMIKIAAAVLILSYALKNLAELDFAKMAQGVIGLGAIMAELSLFAKSMDRIKISASTGLATILIATAILIMAEGVEKLGLIPTDQLIKGLTSIAAILAEIGIFSRLVQPDGILKTSVSMTILGAAILIMAEGIERMGKMPFETVMQGLVGIAAGLTVFGIALELIPSNIGAAASIGILSVSMIALAEAFKILSTIPLTGIGTALVAIIPTLGAAFALFNFLNPIQTLAIAAALAIFAASLNLLIPPFLAFGNMELSEIGLALLAIGGALGIFGLMATLLSAAVIPMLGIAAAMALFGAGVGAFGAGLALLATTGTVAAASLVGSLEIILTAIPNMVTALTNAITAMFKAILGAIEVLIPDLLDTVGHVVESTLEFLLEKMPKFIEMGANVVIAFLDGLASKLPQMVESAINFIATFIMSMANSLETHKDQLIEGIDKLIINIFDLVLGAIVGLLKMIGEHVPEIFKKGVELIGGFLGGIVEKGAEINQKMNEIIDKAGEAIAEKWEEVKQWGADIWNKIKEGFTNAINNITDGAKSIGKNLLAGLGLGLDDPTSQNSLLAKAGGVARSILGKFKDVLGIASPSKQTEALAGWLMEGFVVGIDKTSFRAEDEAAECAEKILEAFGDPLAEMVAKLEEEVEMNPEITPVINLEEFDKGLSEMGMGMAMVNEYMTALDGQHSVSDWEKAYEEWKKNRRDYLSQFGSRGLSEGNTYGLTYDVAFGTADGYSTVQYGKSTIDAVAAAAGGLLNKEQRKWWNENATDEMWARYYYQINYTQNNNSPKSLDADAIYRNTESQLKDTDSIITGAGAGRPAGKKGTGSTTIVGVPGSSNYKVILDS